MIRIQPGKNGLNPHVHVVNRSGSNAAEVGRSINILASGTGLVKEGDGANPIGSGRGSGTSHSFPIMSDDDSEFDFDGGSKKKKKQTKRKTKRKSKRKTKKKN